MSYTKGPWAILDNPTWRDTGWLEIIPAPTEAESFPLPLASARHYLHEVEANANLIAAAPELLEALEILYHEWDQTYDGEPMSIELVAGYKLAKAAIAKARGEV